MHWKTTEQWSQNFLAHKRGDFHVASSHQILHLLAVTDWAWKSCDNGWFNLFQLLARGLVRTKLLITIAHAHTHVGACIRTVKNLVGTCPWCCYQAGFATLDIEVMFVRSMCWCSQRSSRQQTHLVLALPVRWNIRATIENLVCMHILLWKFLWCVFSLHVAPIARKVAANMNAVLTTLPAGPSSNQMRDVALCTEAKKTTSGLVIPMSSEPKACKPWLLLHDGTWGVLQEGSQRSRKPGRTNAVCFRPSGGWKMKSNLISIFLLLMFFCFAEQNARFRGSKVPLGSCEKGSRQLVACREILWIDKDWVITEALRVILPRNFLFFSVWLVLKW